MAALTWYVTNNLAGASHQEMSTTDPGAEAFCGTGPYGWIVGTTAAGNYASADAQTEVAAASFGATIQPDGSIVTTAGAGDCWRTTNTYTGTFDTGNWEFHLCVRANSGATGQDGNAGFRLFRSQFPDGAQATEITAARLEGATVTDLATSATQDSSHTGTSISTFHVDGEYIFVQVGWEITGAATMSSADVDVRIGNGSGNGSRVVTPNFTADTAFGTLVQETQNFVTGTSITLTLPAAATAGNLLVACVRYAGATSIATNPTGFAVAVAVDDGTNVDTGEISYNIAAGGETTFQWSDSVSDGWIGWMGEYNGPWDNDATVADASASSAFATGLTSKTSGTTGATSQDDELAVAAWYSRTVVSALTVNNSFVLQSFVSTGTRLVFTAHKILTAAGTVETTASWTTAAEIMANIATFKKQAVGAAAVKDIIGGYIPFARS